MRSLKVISALVCFLVSSSLRAELPRYQHIDMFVSPCTPRLESKPRSSVVAVRSYSMVYNVEGDWSPSDAKIARHIRQVHGIDPTGMTRAQMLMAHDRAHGVIVQAPRASVSASTCPGGVCPTGKGRRR